MKRPGFMLLRTTKDVLASILSAITLSLAPVPCSADGVLPKVQESAAASPVPTNNGETLPDLFTGTFSYRIPLNVPQGRNGIQPDIALAYNSRGDRGRLGKGWELETSSIERDTRLGVDYSGDSFIFRSDNGAIELVRAGNEYRSKVENTFFRIRKITASDGRPFWEVTDKTGKRSWFGQTPGSRQDDPANPDRIFKWCLDRVEDTNGNYMTMSYWKNKGQIYLRDIFYAGNSTNGTLPTNWIHIYHYYTGDNDIYGYDCAIRFFWTGNPVLTGQ